MSDRNADTDTLQAMLDRLAAGDPRAADYLIEHSMDRLRKMAHDRRVRDRVQRWEQTDDILQNALLRLHRAVKEVKPASVVHYLRLAARQIRRELIDMSRHHFGPEGQGKHHATDPARDDSEATPLHDARPGGEPEPQQHVLVKEIHEQAQGLPEEELEVFDLVFYHGLSQEQAAAQLGISVPTVKRRWRSAKLLLHEALKADAPLADGG
jgi:RNA polymerase sigma-70 factor (ECF subfamily)